MPEDVPPAAPAEPDPAKIRQMQDIRLRQNKLEREKIELEAMRRERIPAVEVRDLFARLRAAMRRELQSLPALADADPSLSPAQRDALRTSLTAFVASYCATMARTDL